MIRKINSVIDGNPREVLFLKIKKFFDKNYKNRNYNFNNINIKKIYDTPIIINSMNRLSYLKQQISWLEKCKLNNIIIIDNQSTYLPLIEFYDKLKYKVIRNQTNIGYLALWYNDIFKNIINDFYVYTDSDILANKICPNDFIEFFYESLIKLNDVDKIGFSLNLEGIDKKMDDEYKITKNESKFWNIKYPGMNIFKAPIDTTFALYKPFTYGGYWLKSGRSGNPFIADHLPWFETDKNKRENLYYNSTLIRKNSFYQSKRNHEY